MIINMTGGGGGGLNFSVVGGTSQPGNPKENTIWVNTDTDISGWAFSATEPGSPEEGMVWIDTVTSSSAEFNALKNNCIQVYPIAAKQYISGAWVNKEAKSYQNGAWVDWIRYFYNKGDEFVDITGGWVAQSQSDIGANAINLHHSDAASQVVTYNKVDITKFKTLHFVFFLEYSNSPGDKDLKCGVSENKNFETYTVKTMVNKTQLLDNTEYVLNVDVGELSGEYYLKLGSYYVSAKVTQVYGE